MIARWHEATKDWRQCVDATPSRHSRPTNSTYTQTQYTQTQYTQTQYTHTLRDGRWRHTRPGLTLMTRLHSLRPPELLQRSTLVNSGQLWSSLVKSDWHNASGTIQHRQTGTLSCCAHLKPWERRHVHLQMKAYINRQEDRRMTFLKLTKQCLFLSHSVPA